MTRRCDKWRDDPPCGELHPDDGIDPKVLFRGRGRKKKDHTRKDRQLCKQAFQLFALLVDQLSVRSWADGLYLVEVVPAPDASRLKVGVGVARPVSLAEAGEVLAQLRGASGRFRRELAAAISRKRVPELFFDLVAGEVHDEG